MIGFRAIGVMTVCLPLTPFFYNSLSFVEDITEHSLSSHVISLTLWFFKKKSVILGNTKNIKKVKLMFKEYKYTAASQIVSLILFYYKTMIMMFRLVKEYIKDE